MWPAVGGYHEGIRMKSTPKRWGLFLGMGFGLALGCGGGVEGPRGAQPESAGSNGQLTAGTSSGVAGSALGMAGGSSAGAPAQGGAPASGGSSGGGANTSQPCGPAWVAGTTYAEGAIVLFEGAYYIAEHENPGYDPTISTYFWDPYSCPTSGGGGAGGAAPVGDSAFGALVSESLFNQMFPDRNGFYTYQGLVAATLKYPAFASTGNADQKKREVAAFLANVSRETGELVYIEQIQKDVLCSPSAKCPCEPGKSYYGRGPIQISWNYNYCSAGDALGLDLRAQPELVAQNSTVAWETGLWFWMTQRGAGTHTPHDAMVGDFGFGETIRSINGDVECNGGSSEGVTSRVNFYQRFCQILGVDFGNNLNC
jgi:predicted chitinase